MKILKSWLNDWIDVDKISGDDLSEALESLGFEIETRTNISSNYKNIVEVKYLRYILIQMQTRSVLLKLIQVITYLK